MSRTLYKMGAIALLAAVLLGVSLLSSTPGYAATRTSSATVATQSNTTITPFNIGNLHCNWHSCSYYFTRHSTGVIAVYGLQASGFLSYIPFAIASYIRLIVAAVDAKAWEAWLKNQCLRVSVGIPSGLFSDGGGYCQN